MRVLVVGDSERNIFQLEAPTAKLRAVASTVHDGSTPPDPYEMSHELSHAPLEGVR
jgi:hypothetical protein